MLSVRGNQKICINNYKTLIIKAIITGALLSLAGAASLYSSAAISNASLSLFVKAAVFPVGLILITLSDLALFTSSVISHYNKPLSLALIWIGNVSGSILTALVLCFLPPEFINQALYNTLQTKCYNLNGFELLVFGFCCNFLICWGVAKSRTYQSILAKVILIFIVVFLFIICGFEHSIANAFMLPFAHLITGAATWSAIFYNLLLVSIGNLLGGLLVVRLKKFFVI